jgi:phospholipid/cholesterol/gamma-HCH transport system ATP-binding protein
MAAEAIFPIPQAQPQTAIVFEDVSLSYETPVLRHLSFTLLRGETKVLFGTAGSGKTLILKLALGLLRPDSGRIFILGEEVSAMREKDLYELRRQMGMVFQESALFDSLDVETNVAFRLLEEGKSVEEVRPRVREALRFVELENTLHLFPAELSGGMKRRVAIARAIVAEPEVLLYDSPTGGLDPVTSTRIVELMIRQRDLHQTSALVVTHRLQDGFIMASHHYDEQQHGVVRDQPGGDGGTRTSFLVLKDGGKYFEGTAEEMIHSGDAYLLNYLEA